MDILFHQDIVFFVVVLHDEQKFPFSATLMPHFSQNILNDTFYSN